MRQNRPTRAAFEGSDISDCRKINKIGHDQISKSSLYIQRVNSIDEYEAGCKEHEDCLGHMCMTPSGLLLPPQSMALRTNIMKNEVYSAAQHAFQTPSRYHYQQYKQILSSMMSGKHGKMRSNVLNAPVDGSLRMVATPHFEEDEDGLFTCPISGIKREACKIVFIPYYLSDKFKVIRIDKKTQRYKSEYVADGDAACCVREPALDGDSNPMVWLYYWHKTALGIHPRLMKGLRGDYDGDEVHIYPLYSDESVECVENWNVIAHPDFDKANKIYSSYQYPDKLSGSMDFMWHTTMSFKELKEGKEPPLMCEYNRMKLEHIEMFRTNLNTDYTQSNMLTSSISGLNSINVQQHSQPIVGDMSRIARLSASSVVQKEDGTIAIITSNGLISIKKCSVDNNSGNSAMRAQSRLCSAAQQVMLNSHRVSKSNMPTHDMVTDLVLGSEFTLVVLRQRSTSLDMDLDLANPDIKWSTMIDDKQYLLCKPSVVTPEIAKTIVACYNPILLSLVPYNKRIAVCRNGIKQVFKQYSVPLSNEEANCMAVLYSYQINQSTSPISSRDGMIKRDMHWFDMCMATSYYALCQKLLQGYTKMTEVCTVSSALATCNFDLLYY